MNPYARLGDWLDARPTVPWPLVVAVGAAVFMFGLVGAWNLAGPARFEVVPKPRPAAEPTEQTVFVPLAQCDWAGCVPVVNLVTPTPGAP